MSKDLVVPLASMYDPVELKKVLDLGLEYILKEKKQYKMNYWYSNLIIVCSLVCSILGVLVWYFPIKWPDSYWFVVAIILIYVIVDGGLTIVMWITHKGFVVQTVTPFMAFYSEMKKYTPIYELTMKKENDFKVSIEIPVNKVIDVEGKLKVNLYEKYVDELMKKKPKQN